jgi:formylglycine-generating enzyme required for sulfatase activity
MMVRASCFALVVGAVVLGPVACDRTESKDESEEEEGSSKKKKSAASASAATTAAADSAPATSASGGTNPAAVGAGPTIPIPAGTFTAGSRCGDVPRVRPDELEGEQISMGEFDIDAHPYPNEPGKQALLNVTWEEAKQLCAARGRRLCTELEWERACKGDKSNTYLWGAAYKNNHGCDGQTDHMLGQRPHCKSDFGVMDMMGVALEWTASDWERGTGTGDKVVRGSRAEKVSWLSSRCAHSRKRAPQKKHDNVGFRCCSGSENSAKVMMRQRRGETIDEEPAIDTPFEMTLFEAMPPDHRGIVDIELSFDKLYKWHPVANEEMVIARWKGEPKRGGAFYEIAVFKICGNRAFRAAKMRGPVERIGKPKVNANAETLAFDVATDGHDGTVKLSYWHGSVKLVEPDWVKQGNQLKVGASAATKVARKRPRMEVLPK